MLACKCEISGGGRKCSDGREVDKSSRCTDWGSIPAGDLNVDWIECAFNFLLPLLSRLHLKFTSTNMSTNILIFEVIPISNSSS